MRELLADNISLYNQLEYFCGHTSSLHPQVREVPSLASRVYCFAAYMAVLTPDPRTCEMLAYCQLIICEALWHGVMAGWSTIELLTSGSSGFIIAVALTCSWSAGYHHLEHPPIWGAVLHYLLGAQPFC